jgi:hypothetical protein
MAVPRKTLTLKQRINKARDAYEVAFFQMKLADIERDAQMGNAVNHFVSWEVCKRHIPKQTRLAKRMNDTRDALEHLCGHKITYEPKANKIPDSLGELV